MIRIPRFLLIGLAASGLTLSSAATLADHDRCGHRHQRDAAWMGAWQHKRQSELHDKLKLSADQESAWQAYVKNTTPPPSNTPDWKTLDSLPAPERMERLLSLMKEREARMADRTAAVRDFYSLLTPEQQKVFDRQFTWHARVERPSKKAPRKPHAAPVSFEQSAHDIES